MRSYTIGQLAANAGVNIETVRYYERRRLIARPAKPSSGGFRQYDDEHLRRIRFIKRAQELGFTLAEIDGLLSLRANDAAECAAVRTTAEAKIAEVQAKVRSLQQIQRALERLIAACRASGHGADCPILDALDHDF